MTMDDALPILAAKLGHAGVDIWVSDMCLHDMGYQVDILSKAIKCGVVRSGTFFVLTFKCNRGHSKASFDEQVSEQRQRLESFSSNVHTFHLFSNRNGERTVVGYIRY